MKALLLLALVATAAIAGEVRTMECKRPVCLMVMEADLDRLVEVNNENYERAEKAEARVRELEARGPKCAKVEVTEPSKKPALKKERDL